MAKTLNNITGMPQVSSAFRGWLSTITLSRVTQIVIDGLVTETTKKIIFKGVVQPLTPEEIHLKPEGQRSFEWIEIESHSGPLDLTTNDRIIRNDKTYKIMGVYDHSASGFISYDAVRDYE